jgi:hypothetical protein
MGIDIESLFVEGTKVRDKLISIQTSVSSTLGYTNIIVTEGIIDTKTGRPVIKPDFLLVLVINKYD